VNRQSSSAAGREPIVTLPNLLTLSRLPLAGLAWAAPGNRTWIVVLIAVAALTDIFDGRFARAIRARMVARGEDPGRLGGAQAVGAWLDPVCDKIFAISVLGAITVGFHPPLWIVLLILTREVVMTPVYLFYRGSGWLRRRLLLDLRASRAGKLATVAQFIAVGAILFAPGPVLIAAAVAASVLGGLAAADYVRRGAIAGAAGASRPDREAC
jgi:cardiolipin synthase (CMP-forming)